MKSIAETQAAICIAGAHRSGTSMVTRLLHCCGLELGPKSELMPPQADNPEGFWEHLGFVALNDELLNELGGAWDLPPKANEDFITARLDPLRLKARLLIEKFDSSSVWGWKDPRNSLTLPFWQQLLPRLKTIVVVRNPLEVAHSMKERNGSSYSFGLRLWEIYNRRAIEETNGKERLISHYDSFFQDPELELLRITDFIGLPNAKTSIAAALVAPRRRHTHFTVEQLIDARVSEEIIDLYRALLAEASRGKLENAHVAKVSSNPNDLLPGSISRLNTFVPERMAQIERLYSDLLAQADARHKAQVEELTRHLEEMNELLRDRSVSLAETEAVAEELRNRLREQLKNIQRLFRFLDETDLAAAQLRSSARWKVANPIAALKAKLSPRRARQLLGYGHLEKIVSTYRKWRSTHLEVAEIGGEIEALASGAVAARKQAIAPNQPPKPTRPIEFSIHEEVEVSIVIPVFNQLRFTQACLASLQEHQGAERFEVIVVDDCSTDETSESVRQIPGIVYLRNETNSGFIASCNRGAEKARAQYLVFLNNDTLVRDGWLRALVDTFSEDPKAGIVGSKLIYPDGRLQEAGGIIWQDASGWNYGKFDDRQKPEYNYLREVDYCSAAALMIPKSLFESVGGFDSRYAPAYYEGVFLRQAPRGKKNVLVIDHHLPKPDQDSGSLRMFQILKLLRQLGHRVAFIPDNLANETPYAAELQKRGIQVVHYPYVKKVRDYLIAHGPELDVVVLSRCDFARKHTADVRRHAPQSRIIFDTVDLHHVREGGEAELTGDLEMHRNAQEKRELEYQAVEQADETWVVSPLEQRLLQESFPAKSIQLVSNIVDIPGSKMRFSSRRDYLFIGGFQHRPNIDAVLFFVQKIYPLVRQHLPDAKFYVLGGKVPPEIAALATERIIIAGPQKDVRPFFDRMKLSIAPLRFGAGVKGKINQSMAFGVPVVATSRAVDGMGLRDREEVLIADEPDAFARAVIELYQSEELWTRLSANGIKKTRELYSPETARRKLEFLFSNEHFTCSALSAPMDGPSVAVAAAS